MANKFPLVVDTANTQITEIVAGDYLDFSSGGIANLAVANTQILGGSSGQVLTTNGLGALSWSTVSTVDPVDSAWISQVADKLGNPSYPSAGAFGGTTRTASTAAELVSAISASTAGDIVQLTADITLTSTLTIDKAIKLTGGYTLQSAGGTTDPVTLISVTAAAYIDSTITIKHRKTSNTSVETAVSVNTTGFVSEARVEFMEFGYVLRGSFRIGGQTVYTGALGNNHRHIGIYNLSAPSIVDGVVFDFPQEATARSNFIYVTSNNSVTERFESILRVTNCSHALTKSCRQFFLGDAWYVTGRNASLWFDNNRWDDVNGGIGIFSSDSAVSPLNVFTAIVLYKNVQGTAGDTSYKGLVYIDGSGTVREIGAPTVLAQAYNNSPQVLRSDYSWAVSSDIAYKNTGFTAATLPPVTFGDENLAGMFSTLRVTGTTNLGAVGNVTVTGGSNGQFLTTNGNGVLSWTTPAAGNAVYAESANTANIANIANISYNVSGANVSGEVANANYATWSGTANTANSATVAASANSVSGANVSGEVANANYATWSGTAYSVSGSNVSGEVANANYATYAGTANTANSATVAASANSVSGANVSGEVANANYATWSGTANTANSATVAASANSVSGSNVSGEVANANYATWSGTAAVANSVTLANVSGAGNIASINLDGNVANVLSGNGTWIALNTGAVANANYANFAGTAYSVSGANVSGEVANANYATYAGSANTANSATVAASANSVTLANVSGAGNIASINLDGNVSNVLQGDGSWGPVSAANANYANFAGTAYSVSGSNVSGEVANANYATYAGTANTANSATVAASANSVAGANVTGTVANATYATSAGTANSATVAASANSVSGANVVGEVANAAYATNSGTAATANSVAGANVTGTVANATYATSAGTANSATVAASANSVAGANVVGEVANAAYATSAGTANSATVAASANSVAGANVTGTVANANYSLYAGTAYSVDGANVSGTVANANYATTAGSVSGGNISNVDHIDFDTTSTSPVVDGRMVWNAGEGTVDIGLTGGVTLNVGTQEYARVYNDEATTLAKGEIVYVSGAQGNRVAVKRAQANSEATSVGTLGMVTANIASGAEGYVIVSGAQYKLDTSTLAAGAPIYLSPSVAGAYTTTKPTAPDHLVTLGWVERVDNTVGSIYIKVDNGYELDELHSVNISNVQTSQALIWNGNVWTNSNIASGNLRDVQVNNGSGALASAQELNANGRIYIGTNSQLITSGDAGQPLQSYRYNNTANSGSTILAGRARGTRAAPTTVQVGDQVGGLLNYAYTANGTLTVDTLAGYANAWFITGLVDALPASNGSPNMSVSISATSTANAQVQQIARFYGGNRDTTLANNVILSTGNVVMSTSRTPASASDTGTTGTIVWDANYVYVCVATNTWKRSALSTW